MATSTNVNANNYYPDLKEEVGPRTNVSIRLLYQKLQEHDQAFASLKTQLDGKTVITNTTTNNSGSGGSSGGSSGGGGTTVSGLGGTNNQTDTTYIVQNSDYGGIITFSNASAIAVTLNSAVNLRWFSYLEALGAGDVTLTPDIGGATINGQSSLVVPVGSGAIVFFDGMNWWALTSRVTTLETNGTPNADQGTLNLVAGSNITLVNSGADVTISSSGGGGGPTMTSNSNGRAADYGNGYVEQWGLSAAAATGGSRATVHVTFPIAFAGTPVVVADPDNNPDSYGGAVFSTYAINVTTFGCDIEFTCGVTIGGGGPSNILNVVHANWIAKYYP